MRIAALTQVYNESFSLPVWIAYYGRLFGRENLFVLDHGSDDGSTEGLGPVNVIRLPRTPFEDARKCASVSGMQQALAQYFDAVVVGDCDELVAADPARHADLRAYIESVRPTVMTALGLQVHHLLDEELPIDLSRPILSQRRLALFSTPGSKPAIACGPVRFRPGQHVCDVRPGFDSGLFLVHLKFMDYNVAIRRHAINTQTDWSEAQQAAGHGMHHRYGGERFVQEGFLVPMDVNRRALASPFEFSAEIAVMEGALRERNGFFFPGEAPAKFVTIPERFANVL